MVWHKLGRLVRHIGSKIIHGTEGALEKVTHMGKKIYEHAGRIPVVGGAIQGAMDMAYHTSLPVIGSLKNAHDNVRMAVQVGKHLVSEDPDVRKEGYTKILNGDLGSTAQRGAQAVQRIASAIG